MRSVAILDAGPLIAAADSHDRNHAAVATVLRRRDLDLIIPALVVAEATYLVGSRFGPQKEAAFVRELNRFAIEPPIDADWPAIADLVELYAGLRLGTSDAATIVLADRLDTDLVVTLDRRHFTAVRSPGGRHFRLLPEGVSVHEDQASYPDRGP